MTFYMYLARAADARIPSLALNEKSIFKVKPSVTERNFVQSQSPLVDMGMGERMDRESTIHDRGSYGSDSEALGSDIEPETEIKRLLRTIAFTVSDEIPKKSRTNYGFVAAATRISVLCRH